MTSINDPKPQEPPAGGGMRRDPLFPNPFPPAEAGRPTIVGSRYVVSAGHPLVALVAARVFERGGNAIDAGVAAAMAANVVQSDMCNFGGVAPIIVRGAGSDEVHSIEGLGWWGSRATLQAYRERYGDDMPLGAPIALVPAAPAAYLAALETFGTLSFAEVADPAIELAADGFALDQRLASSLEVLGRTFERWPSSREVYWPAARAPTRGDWLRQPELARLLERLTRAEVGDTRASAIEAVRREFYEGEPARRIVDFTDAAGGWLSLDDLSVFRADVVPAVRGTYAEHQVFVPDTWCQGPAILAALGILERFDLAGMGLNSADYIHTLIEAIKLAFWDRERYFGDPRYVDVGLGQLLSREHLDELASRIVPGSVLPVPAVRDQPSATSRRADTTYLCTLDQEGNAFSATLSDTLDGGPVVPGLGIIVSPRGVQSHTQPGHPACIGPRKRPRLTPAPALALVDSRGGEPSVAPFGCPGGDVILQAMLQGFLNLVEFGLSPQEALEAPRFASASFPDSFFPHDVRPDVVYIEDRIDAGIRTTLESRGHDVHEWAAFDFDAGAVAVALELQPSGGGRRVMAAAADPRRIGYAIGR